MQHAGQAQAAEVRQLYPQGPCREAHRPGEVDEVAQRHALQRQGVAAPHRAEIDAVAIIAEAP